MMKKLIALLLVLAMALAMVPAVLAEEVAPEEGKPAPKKITVYYYNGSDLKYEEEIPDTTKIFYTTTKVLADGKFYSFLGWSRNPKADEPETEIRITKEIKKAAKIELFAVWGKKRDAQELTIKYYNGNTKVHTDHFEDIRSYGTINLWTDMEEYAPEGKEFAGWKFRGGNKTFVSIDTDDIEGEELKLYAEWKDKEHSNIYKIVYKAAHGSLTALDDKVVTANFDKHGNTVLEKKPTWWNIPKGFTFLNWVNNPVQEQKITSLTKADFSYDEKRKCNVCDVFAVWDVESKAPKTWLDFEIGSVSVTITPELNGKGQFVMPDAKDLVDSLPYGKCFTYWTIKNTFFSEKYYAGVRYNMDDFQDEDIVLVANFTSCEPVYDYVTFYANDGTGNCATRSYRSLSYTKGYLLPTANALDLDRYWNSKTRAWIVMADTFVCWNTKANGTGKNYYADTYYSSVPDVLYAVWTAPIIVKTLPFTDVSPMSWYYDAISNVYFRGLMDGVTATKFVPNGYLDRGMLVTILWRYAGQKKVATSNPFSDVVKNFYYTEAINWAYANRVINGITAAEFAPSKYITREQLAAVLWRYNGCPKSTQDLSAFIDSTAIRPYALEAMKWAVEKGYLAGTANYLHPGEYATRAEVAVIFSRMK